MATGGNVNRQVTGVSFAFYTSDEIRKLSVKQITNPVLLDAQNHPSIGGLYDAALGPFSFKDSCATCHQSNQGCPGHFGHVELLAPCYNPVTFSLMYKLLQSLCYYCHRLRMSRVQAEHFHARFLLIRAGLLAQAIDLDTHVSSKAVSRAKSHKTDDAKKKKTSIADVEAVEDSNGSDEEIEDDNGIDRMDDSTNDTIFEEYQAAQPKTEADIIEAIHKYVDNALAEAGITREYAESSIAAKSKSTLATDMLRKLERQFLASIPPAACQNCRGISPKFRNDKMNKIFEKDLSEKNKNAMKLKKLQFEPLFGHSGRSLTFHKEQAAVANNEDVDDDESNKEVAMAIKNNNVTIESSRPIAESDSEDDIEAAKKAGAASAARGKRESETARYLSSMEVREHINLLFERDSKILNMVFGSSPDLRKSGDNVNKARLTSPHIFFLDVIAVPPTRFRPASKMGDMVFEDAQNLHLTEILKANTYIRQQRLEWKQEYERIHSAAAGKFGKISIEDSQKLAAYLSRIGNGCVKLQEEVNYLIDSSKQPAKMGGVPPPGVRQLLEKKEGLFRKHMMGKRVNYAARSVISPDPYIETNEIGIPPVFASKLTYPEAVTPHNFENLRQAVINGPNKWPGATFVQNEDGRLILLEKFDESGRTALANQLLTPSVGDGGDGRVKRTFPSPPHLGKKANLSDIS
ncbi:hypothetical protein HK100_012689 [Physocladia obscura]|uniref:DNA-directed RNA polymerase subunit n=1 Tax=Physocladia obscura TaxID=109957 RepID=A0AAD5XHF8_9FUNG|nr:hypothetical protein HK100_012689 [Physocladia obscura]